MKNYPCPLCESKEVKFYIHTHARDFFCCINCQLIFVAPEYLLDRKEEKIRYDKHQNNLIDEGYKAFLYQVIDPLLNRLKPNSKGLDIGCGPFPALATLLEKEKFKVALYDPFYVKNEEVFTKKYDFITLTEVVEHMYNPAKEFKRIIPLLKPKAYLAIMTAKTDNIDDFETWYYKNDPTHVSLYANATFQFLAKIYNLKLEIISERVVILQKK